MPETDPASAPHHPELISPPPRHGRVVATLVTVLMSAAVAAVAFVLFTALNHVGRVVQHDVHVAVDDVADLIAAAHCGPPARRWSPRTGD